jgi:hypothetical protein
MKCLAFAAAFLVSVEPALAQFAGAPYQALDAGDVFVTCMFRFRRRLSRKHRKVWWRPLLLICLQ